LILTAVGAPLKDDYQYHRERKVTNDHPKPKGTTTFGKGISEEEILKIIDEFEEKV
jgi:hypothetical protein